MMCTIHFGGEQAEFLTLTVHGRSSPDASDYWDGNWLSCTAVVSAGAFHGTLDSLLRNEDLARFLHRLEGLTERLSGEAVFDTLDGWLDVRLIGDGRGHVEVRGQLVDAPASGNSLEFRFCLDQTYLTPLAAQLRAVLDLFPVIGQQGT
jgi:hypothetical protein